MAPSRTYCPMEALSKLIRQQNINYFRMKSFYQRREGVDFVCRHQEICEDCEELTSLLEALQSADEEADEAKLDALNHFLDEHEEEIAEYSRQKAEERASQKASRPTKPRRDCLREALKEELQAEHAAELEAMRQQMTILQEQLENKGKKKVRKFKGIKTVTKMDPKTDAQNRLPDIRSSLEIQCRLEREKEEELRIIRKRREELEQEIQKLMEIISGTSDTRR